VKSLGYILLGVLVALSPRVSLTVTIPVPSWSVITPVATVDRVTLVYDKDGPPVLPGVRAGINSLNNRGIVADLYEVNDDEEIKPAYVAAVDAAKKAGLPSLVVMAGGKVIRVVKSPATEAAVTEAVQ
jgi:hypothetical protein